MAFSPRVAARLTAFATLASAALALLGALAMLDRVRLVDIISLFFGGVGAGAGMAALLVQRRRHKQEAAATNESGKYRAASSAANARALYLYVEEDGSARELSADEAEYLATAFDPSDGGRPYIKDRYSSRTPVGRLRGFLERKELPADVRVRPKSP